MVHGRSGVDDSTVDREWPGISRSKQNFIGNADMDPARVGSNVDRSHNFTSSLQDVVDDLKGPGHQTVMRLSSRFGPVGRAMVPKRALENSAPKSILPRTPHT